MFKSKRILLSVLLVTSTLTIVTACGNSGSVTEKNTEVAEVSKSFENDKKDGPFSGLTVKEVAELFVYSNEDYSEEEWDDYFENLSDKEDEEFDKEYDRALDKYFDELYGEFTADDDGPVDLQIDEHILKSELVKKSYNKSSDGKGTAIVKGSFLDWDPTEFLDEIPDKGIDKYVGDYVTDNGPVRYYTRIHSSGLVQRLRFYGSSHFLEDNNPVFLYFDKDNQPKHADSDYYKENYYGESFVYEEGVLVERFGEALFYPQVELTDKVTYNSLGKIDLYYPWYKNVSKNSTLFGSYSRSSGQESDTAPFASKSGESSGEILDKDFPEEVRRFFDDEDDFNSSNYSEVQTIFVDTRKLSILSVYFKNFEIFTGDYDNFYNVDGQKLVKNKSDVLFTIKGTTEVGYDVAVVMTKDYDVFELKLNGDKYIEMTSTDELDP